jgi:hypothetical protein
MKRCIDLCMEINEALKYGTSIAVCILNPDYLTKEALLIDAY